MFDSPSPTLSVCRVPNAEGCNSLALRFHRMPVEREVRLGGVERLGSFSMNLYPCTLSLTMRQVTIGPPNSRNAQCVNQLKAADLELWCGQ